MRPCEECDFIGPELPSVVRDMRDLHRAVHGLTDVFMVPLTDWATRVDRSIEARGEGLRRVVMERGPRRKWRP